MAFKVSRTIQTTISIVVDHEEDAVAIASESIEDFVDQVVVGGTGENELNDYKWKEKGAPAIVPIGRDK